MSNLERQIRAAQRRLWWNRFLLIGARSLAVAGGLFAITVLIQRLFDLPIPLLWIGGGLVVVALLASGCWAWIRREGSLVAAARLDLAAGTRERISSGMYCLNEDDPFAQAVVADAQRAGASLTVREHIRLKFPEQFAFTVGSFALAALMFLLTPGLLKSDKAVEASEQSAERKEVKIAVKREMERIQQFAEANPALEDLSAELKKLDQPPPADLQRPDLIRHEAVKKIDRLEDAVRQKRADEKYDAVPEMKRMMRGLSIPQSEQAPTQKLAKSLAKGDFKEAKEEIAKLKEQLATLKSEQDKEMVKQMSKQLDDLAKQIEKLASDEKLAQKLEQAGIKKEDAKRMLERLSKADLDQLQKKLQEQGMSQKQIEKIAQQMKKRQQAGSMAKKMAQGMKKAAQAANSGQMGQAMSGLQSAGDQLGELEQLEQEMNQLESAMSATQQARNNLGNKPCPNCNGKGCAKCGQQHGDGSGPQPGQGRGGLSKQEKTDVAFKVERAKVKMGKGAIIGQFLIDGEQVRGEVSSSINEVVTAGEREASDLIHRDRIPRQYHKAIKDYFSTLREETGAAPPAKEKSPGTTDDDAAEAEHRDKPDS